MNGTSREHEAEWLTPAPLWAAGGDHLRAPAVVRLDGDDFMEQFARMLAPGPDRAANLSAARPGAPDAAKLPGVLYQPLHGCYALVCASLTCKIAGRPEKAVAPARGESVAFVLRRVEGPGTESAWVPAGSGEGAWRRATGKVPEAGEEVIPLFPVPAPGSPPRRVWTGLVPTASRETYRRGPPLKSDPPNLRDRRLAELEDGPLAALGAAPVAVPAGDPRHDAVGRAAVEAALQAALGLADFLSESVLLSGADAPADLFARLQAHAPGGPRLVQALAAAGLVKAMTHACAGRAVLLGIREAVPVFDPDAGGLTLPVGAALRDDIFRAVMAALPELADPPPDLPTGPAQPKFDAGRNRRYVIRCVYLRRDCPSVASAPSEAFAVAPVHDPDAPARTIRIPMPIDVSVGGLRKFKKNVGFVLSAGLNAKVQSLSGKKLKDIDDGNVSAGGVGLGEICTFALPIITLCAMIVLFIFLVLLNIVFFWMPLLKICFPIPKEESS